MKTNDLQHAIDGTAKRCTGEHWQRRNQIRLLLSCLLDDLAKERDPQTLIREWASTINAWPNEYRRKLAKVTKPREKFYAIISPYLPGEPIGYCCESGKPDAEAEDPGVTFKRITKEQFRKATL